MDINNKKEGTTLTPIKAIRAKCLDCCAGQFSEVKLCPVTSCPLYPYRLGKNPNRTSTMTDEQKEAARDRLNRARLAKTSNDNV